jgi:hypothetical protein
MIGLFWDRLCSISNFEWERIKRTLPGNSRRREEVEINSVFNGALSGTPLSENSIHILLSLAKWGIQCGSGVWRSCCALAAVSSRSDELEGTRKNRSLLRLSYCRGICRAILRENTKNLSQDIWSPDWDLNPGPPKYAAVMLSHGPRFQYYWFYGSDVCVCARACAFPEKGSVSRDITPFRQLEVMQIFRRNFFRMEEVAKEGSTKYRQLVTWRWRRRVLPKRLFDALHGGITVHSHPPLFEPRVLQSAEEVTRQCQEPWAHAVTSCSSELTMFSRILPQKLLVAQLFKRILSFYEIGIFVTVFKTSRHWVSS